MIEHFPRRYRSGVRRDVKRAQRKDHLRAVARHTHDVDGHLRLADDPPFITHLDDTGHDLDDVCR